MELLKKKKKKGGNIHHTLSQNEIVLLFKVSLFIRSWKQREFVDLVCLDTDLNFLHPKLHSAPLKKKQQQQKKKNYIKSVKNPDFDLRLDFQTAV